MKVRRRVSRDDSYYGRDKKAKRRETPATAEETCSPCFLTWNAWLNMTAGNVRDVNERKTGNKESRTGFLVAQHGKSFSLLWILAGGEGIGVEGQVEERAIRCITRCFSVKHTHAHNVSICVKVATSESGSRLFPSLLTLSCSRHLLSPCCVTRVTLSTILLTV